MKQMRLTDQTSASSENNIPIESDVGTQEETTSTRLLDVKLDELKKHPLWPILVETAQRNPLFPGVVSYALNNILPSMPNITPRELASRLSISLGEALVILDRLRQR